MTTPAPVVSYRPEPSLWFFIACLAATLVFGFLVWVDPQMNVASGAVLLLLWPFALGSLWSGRKRLIISRNDQQGSLDIELRRWPLASRTTSHSLAEIRDVIVEVDPMAEALTHRVALVLAPDTKVPLTKSYCSKSARHERAAGEIRALLSR